MSEQRLLLSFPPPPNGTIYVNDRVSFRTEYPSPAFPTLGSDGKPRLSSIDSEDTGQMVDHRENEVKQGGTKGKDAQQIAILAGTGAAIGWFQECERAGTRPNDFAPEGQRGQQPYDCGQAGVVREGDSQAASPTGVAAQSRTC